MPYSKIKLVKIDPKEVEAHPENFNSYFHTQIEVPHLRIPDEAPYAYHRWLGLIASSQDIPRHFIQTITLTKPQALLLIESSRSSLQTKVINRMYKEDLDNEVAPAFRHLRFPPEGLFMRLDACSPKDGVRGVSPVGSIDEILLRLTTSARALSSMNGCLERGEESVRVFLLPYDEKMSTKREFRAFCRPESGAISAISQYKWHAPFYFPSQNVAALVEKITGGIEKIHETIRADLLNAMNGTEKEASEMAAMMVKQGYSFDVMWDEVRGKVSLIELNTFGARSGCGSCLFHWIRDMDVLYGRSNVSGQSGQEQQQAEFRISMVPDDSLSSNKKLLTADGG